MCKIEITGMIVFSHILEICKWHIEQKGMNVVQRAEHIFSFKFHPNFFSEIWLAIRQLINILIIELL